MAKTTSTVVEVTPEREAAATEAVRSITSRKWDDPADAALAQAEISLEILRTLRRVESHLKTIADREE